MVDTNAARSTGKEAANKPVSVQPPCLLDSWLRVDSASGQIIESARLRRPATGGASLAVSAAQNEYVSFQVALPADWFGPKLRVTLSGLPAAAGISSRDLEWFVEWPIRSEQTWYPDALIPAKCLEASQKLGLLSRIDRPRVVVLWVDLFVPREGKPGRYSATVRVQSEARQEAELGLDLNVWPFAIPDECHIVADMNSYSGGFVQNWPPYSQQGFDYLTSAGGRRILHGYYRMAHEHRGMMHSLNYRHSGAVSPGLAPELVGLGDQIRVKSWTLFDQCWGPMFDGSAFRGTRRGEIPVPYSYTPFNFNWPASFIYYGQPGYKVAWERIGDQFAEHARQHGWNRTKFEIFFNHKKRYRFFPFDGDETRFLADEQIFRDFHEMIIKQWRARKDVRFIFRTDTSWAIGHHTRNDIADLFDLWVASAGISGWFKEGMENLQSKGAEVFYYGGAPSYCEDLQSMARWPLVPWMRGGQGFTPWMTTDAGKEPLMAGPTGKGSVGLFYPGVELGLEGPLANLRTKAMRNSMQTTEYLWLLASRDGGRRTKTWDLVNKVMGVDWSAWWQDTPAFTSKPPNKWVGQDWSTPRRIDSWDHSDPRDFERLRTTAGEELAKG